MLAVLTEKKSEGLAAHGLTQRYSGGGSGRWGELSLLKFFFQSKRGAKSH